MLSFIRQLAENAGQEAMRYFAGERKNTISTKATVKDLVSEADKAVEQILIRQIREKYPDHDVYGEESGRTGSSARFCWVIDPIDGTQSFVKKHPYFCISIALKENGIPRFGVVYAPALGLLFEAERGNGAFENGKPIHCSDCTDLSMAACSTGFACLRAGLRKNNLRYFVEIVPRIRDIKRCGSAALDLCFAASARYDAYWELSPLQEYDVAAGALIMQEAGGVVCDLKGGREFPQKGILAAPPALVPEFLPFFSDY